MAYFQMKWTESAGDDNPFNNGNNILTHTETSGDFSSKLNLKENVIPYPPSEIIFNIPSTNVVPCIVIFNWTPSIIPTPYEVNPLLYTYRVYDNDTNELMTTAQTTSLTGTFTLPNMTISLTTSQIYTTVNKDYIGHYFYSNITTTGGGGTSEPSVSALSWYYPQIMMAGTVNSFSITILAGVITIDVGMSFSSNPFSGGVTQVNLALQSSDTSSGSYSLTDNYDTQTSYGSNIPGEYEFNYDVAYGVPAGKYYKIYSVQTTSDGSKLPSYLSTWNSTPFLYNPKMSTPTLIQYTYGFTSYFIRSFNHLSFELTPGTTSPVLPSVTSYTWTLYTALTENGTYTATTSSDTFADSGSSTTTYNPDGTIAFSPAAPVNTWCKLYVIAISTYILPSDPLISDAFKSPNVVSTPLILSFNIVSSTEFNASWKLSVKNPPATVWNYYIYESITQSGTYEEFDSFTYSYINDTVALFTTTLNNTFTSGYWYKLYVVGTGNNIDIYSSYPGISSALQAS